MQYDVQILNIPREHRRREAEKERKSQRIREFAMKLQLSVSSETMHAKSQQNDYRNRR